VTADVPDLDPLDATTVAEFAACLRRVRVRAGNPSYRTLQKWGERNRSPLPRSTLRDALAGVRLPRKSLVLAFVRACGVPASDRRWEIAWTRLAERTKTTASQDQSRHHLARDTSAAGLLRIGATFLTDLEWTQLFAEATELDIVVAYGRTWRNLHAPELARLAAKPDRRIRVILADPDDEPTVTVLASRFATTPTELRQRITTTRADYERLHTPGGAAIEIYYRPGDRVFSFYRFDDIAIVGLYSHSRTRNNAVPVFVCARPGELYGFVQDELAVILEQSRLV
jgi:hypothetical protein